MSSKLKRKTSAVKTLAPFTNRQVQHFAMEMHATQAQLKKMEEEIWADAWTDAEDWSNTVNTCTLMLALYDLYGFSGKRMADVIRKSNEYVKKLMKDK